MIEKNNWPIHFSMKSSEDTKSSNGKPTEDCFPDLESIVLCEFDSIVGPRMSCQFPSPSSLDDDVFRRVYHFLIIKRNDLCENGISWTDDNSGLTLAGYPVLIENSKYARNALIYNVCLVGGRNANCPLLLCMAEKLARLLKAAELQFGFLSKAENRSEKLGALIENIYCDLKSKGETKVVLEGSFPFFVALPKIRVCPIRSKNLRTDIKPAEVPFLKDDACEEKWSISDCIGRKLVQAIDGKMSVVQLAHKLPIPYTTVAAVTSQLVRLGLIGLRPTVNNWDMYTVTPKLNLLLADEKLRNQCIKQATLAHPGDVLIEPATLSNILSVLTQLQHGITIGDLKVRNKALIESVDVSKLILFALEHQLIRRVYVSPVYTPAEQRPSGGSNAAADAESLFGLSGSTRASEMTNTTLASRGVFSVSANDDSPYLEPATTNLMDGNHPLEFIAARSALDPGDLLRAVRSDPACELLLR